MPGWWPHPDQDSKEEASAELLHAFGRHAAVIAVVSLLLHRTGLHIWRCTVAWKEGALCAPARAG